MSMMLMMMMLPMTITMTTAVHCTGTTFQGVFDVGVIMIVRHKIGHSTLHATGEHRDTNILGVQNQGCKSTCGMK